MSIWIDIFYRSICIDLNTRGSWHPQFSWSTSGNWTRGQSLLAFKLLLEIFIYSFYEWNIFLEPINKYESYDTTISQHYKDVSVKTAYTNNYQYKSIKKLTAQFDFPKTHALLKFYFKASSRSDVHVDQTALDRSVHEENEGIETFSFKRAYWMNFG